MAMDIPEGEALYKMKKLPMIRSTKAAVIWSLVLALPLLLLLSDRMFLLWSLFIILYVLPWGLGVSCLTGGLLPMLVGTGSGIAALYISFGSLGALVGALMILLPAVVFCVINMKEVPFAAACRWMIFALLTGQAAALAVMRFAAPGGDILGAVANAAQKAITDLGDAGDLTLNLMENFGLLSIPESLMELAAGATLPLPDALRSELLNQVGDLARGYLLTLIPMCLGGMNLYFGVGVIGLSQHFGRKSRVKRGSQEPFPQLGMPMLQNWHLPKPWGLVFALMALGVFLQQIGGSPVPILIGELFYGLFTTAYTFQGVAVINDIQHKRGTGRGWRIALPVLLMIFLPMVLILAGVMDQARDPRGLRRKPGAEENRNDNNDMI